jgi:hypothetical protein
MDPASHRIQGTLQFGLLPSVDPLTLRLGLGRGAYCDGCDAELTADHAEPATPSPHLAPRIVPSTTRGESR